MRLKDKAAIITGGGSGFGEVTARLFASEGAAVMLADINGPAAEAVAKSINNEGGRASWAKTDVSSASSVEAMVQATLSNFERVDILFNNAGIESFGTVIESDEATWDRTFAVHVRGAFLCSKYALPAMIDSGRGGVVINVSSVAGLVGLQHMSAYSADKGAIISLTRAVAADVGQHGIIVNAVTRGTSMTTSGEDLAAND